jgi:hypothetical protein
MYSMNTASNDPRTLAALLLAGQATELDYMTADEQSANLDRVEWLSGCESDELADAADFIALAVTQ